MAVYARPTHISAVLPTNLKGDHANGQYAVHTPQSTLLIRCVFSTPPPFIQNTLKNLFFAIYISILTMLSLHKRSLGSLVNILSYMNKYDFAAEEEAFVAAYEAHSTKGCRLPNSRDAPIWVPTNLHSLSGLTAYHFSALGNVRRNE